MTLTLAEPDAIEERVHREVLLVDDDEALLAALGRAFRKNYDVVTASGPEQGLAALDECSFAVVISDLRMPVMNGIEFLAESRRRAPDTVRMLLTGNADLDSAIEVVNQGLVFRFLSKPAPPEHLRVSIDTALEQYKLVIAERELLEKTLRGSVQMMLDTLALANPAAFSRATRIKEIVADLLDALDVVDRWEIEVAAMLSQVGAVTLPPAVVEKLHRGASLELTEQEMLDRLPEIACDLLAPIPRLEGVRDSIRLQNQDFEATQGPRGDALPLGARVLRLALDFEALEAQHLADGDAIGILGRRRGAYDPAVLEALERARPSTAPRLVKEITLKQLLVGMVLARDVKMRNGTLLVGRGHRVTEQMLDRIDNYARTTGITEPLYISEAAEPFA